jgi:gluconokinase
VLLLFLLAGAEPWNRIRDRDGCGNGWHRIVSDRSTAEATVVVLFGPSGAGKTTAGRRLAERLGWEFADADDFHSPANVEKMRRGIGLDDDDRRPWLDALRAAIEGWISEGRQVVLACSALTRAYRQQLSAGPAVLFIYLKGDYGALEERLRSRAGHFAGPEILPGQLETLEEPGPDEPAITVNAARPVEDVVAQICSILGYGAGGGA